MEHSLGTVLPLYSAIPFVGMLLSIALGPVLFPHFWHHHFGKLSAAWAALVAVPLIYTYRGEGINEILTVIIADYIPFIILLGALFTVGGGILLRTSLKGTTGVNIGFLAIGAFLASWMGTTGAAMLLIRPFLRVNKHRKYRAFMVVFFIFAIANVGGALTPLGDPPLFLGFLHGVPFFWTLRLILPMLTVLIPLLMIYYVFDKYYLKKEAKEEAADLIKRLEGHEAMVKKVEVKVKKEQAPLLFNLAELQSEANKKFKLPVNKTLEIAQSLYEKKLISYPRTDSRVLSTDVVPELPKVLNGLYKNPDFKDAVVRIKEFGKLGISKSTKRYVDDSKVTDHYAIIPTYMTTDLSKLDGDTATIYSLIVKRFLAIFYPPAEYCTVKVETEIDSELFVTNSKVLNVAGWKEIYDAASTMPDEELSASPIQNLIKKEKCQVAGLELDEKETKPPPRFTDGALIITMEKAGRYIENEELREQIKTCGIGTSATRSGIIKKLVDIGHIKINPKTQIVTPELKGEAIVELVRSTAKELLNPTLTASWEKGLFMIENHEITETVFEEKLSGYITRTIEKVKRSGNMNQLFQKRSFYGE